MVHLLVILARPIALMRLPAVLRLLWMRRVLWLCIRGATVLRLSIMGLPVRLAVRRLARRGAVARLLSWWRGAVMALLAIALRRGLIVLRVRATVRAIGRSVRLPRPRLAIGRMLGMALGLVRRGAALVGRNGGRLPWLRGGLVRRGWGLAAVACLSAIRVPKIALARAVRLASSEHAGNPSNDTS